MVESWPASISTSASKKMWPFTMDYGMPNSCNYMAPEAVCDQQNDK